MNAPPLRRIIIKGMAGFGNRLQVLAHGILYAEASGRALAVDWRDGIYSNDQRSNIFPSFFSLIGLKILDIKEAYSNYSSVYPTAWQERMEQGVPQWRREIIRDNPSLSKEDLFRILQRETGMLEIDRPEDIVILWANSAHIDQFPNTLKKRLYGSTNAQLVLKKIFSRHLRLAPEIAEQITAYRLRHFKDRIIIGVHIRHSDNVSLYPIQNPIEKCIAATRKQLQQEPSALIFLATDNSSVENTFRKIFGSDKVLTTEKWYPVPGESAHRNRLCPDRYQNGVEALIDLYLLAYSNVFLGQKMSTFSEIVSLITEQPPQTFWW